MKFRFPGHIFVLCAASLIYLPATLVAQQAVSHVRVVRLSYLSGTVAVKQPGAADWTKALVNAPIQEGFEVSTSADSFAEVEFENGSTARLGQFSHLVFDQLAQDAEGDKLNRMTFDQGYATFHFLPEKGDVYSVKVADATLTPNGKSLFRTDLDKIHVRVEVFNGSVQIAAPSRSSKLGKDKVLEYTTGTTEVALNTQHGIVKDDWDKWVDARDSQAQLALNDQAVAARGPRYGWSDLDTYGEWAMLPGYGYGWSPFVPMGWSPYSMGMWGWYSGMGYTWISGEPWGWLPYHYGMWNFSSNFGWFWMPGNFGAWSPAMVSWYTGPGWVGWAPLGVSSQLGVAKPVTTISGTAIQTGQLITPGSVGHAGFSEGTLTQNLPFHPAAPLTGTPQLAGGAATAFSAHAGGAHTLAPPSILMGSEGSKESAMLGGRSSRAPLRVRQGTTLGGRYAVGGTVGVFRGDAINGRGGTGGTNRGSQPVFSRGNGQPGPTVLSHGQAAQSSRSGGGEVMRSGGGGGGFSSPGSAGMSSSSASHSVSSSPSGGGGHH